MELPSRTPQTLDGPISVRVQVRPRLYLCTSQWPNADSFVSATRDAELTACRTGACHFHKPRLVPFSSFRSLFHLEGRFTLCSPDRRTQSPRVEGIGGASLTYPPTHPDPRGASPTFSRTHRPPPHPLSFPAHHLNNVKHRRGPCIFPFSHWPR